MNDPIIIDIDNIHIKRTMLNMIKCKDKDNKILVQEENATEFPENTFSYDYITTAVSTTHSMKNDKGKWKDVLTFTSTWSEDIALAIFNNTAATLKESIVIAATSCEACINILADTYGLSWGYPSDSDEFRNRDTSCDFCRGNKHE
jgi:hypothetical protein